MPSQDDIDRQLQLLDAHRATLNHYLVQRARLGTGYAPPGVSNGIAEARAQIARCKVVLRGWGATVEDHPDDEDRPPTPDRVQVPTPATTAPATARVTLLIEGDLPQFTPEEQAGFMFLLARAVNVSTDQIRVVHIESGSIKLTLDMPEEAARRLL